MPRIEYALSSFVAVTARIQRYDESTKSYDYPLKSSGGAKALGAQVSVWANSDDWDFSTPFEGVKLEVTADGLATDQKGVTYHTTSYVTLTWEQAKALHTFLGFLLTQEPDLHLSAEDKAAAAEDPDRLI